MTPELPPLHWVGAMQIDNASFQSLATEASVYARERILLAYIASLEAINENNLAEAAARIAELEAVLARFDERWIMDGELGFCTACGVSIEGGESHKPDCWLAEARAAIDAAREAKP